MKFVRLFLMGGLVLMFAITGCDKKNNPVVPDEAVGTYVGFFVSVDTTAGLIVVNVESSGNVNGSAYLWEDSLVAVGIAGRIENNVFTGSATDSTPLVGSLEGTTITGTAGGGEAVFTLERASGTVTVLKYSGSYSGTSVDGPESGGLFLLTAATTMWGVVLDSVGTADQFLIGVISGSSVSLRGADDLGTEIATGSLSGNTWSGTYSGDQSSGTWSATRIP
ncbi:MAG: hypothetical protein HBSIN02_04070 [Bacteroidia bacterium]|nr:MAG: hypothetical protein HBSIN02_04070 [Bacteroidia bacterium]